LIQMTFSCPRKWRRSFNSRNKSFPYAAFRVLGFGFRVKG
jgi:hypothetical protein